MYTVKIFYLNSYFASNVFSIICICLLRKDHTYIFCNVFYANDLSNVINIINYKNKEFENFATVDLLMINLNIKYNKLINYT